MNFFDNIPKFPQPVEQPMLNNPMIMNNDINYKINELELKIKKLEQRISLLETNNNLINHQEPDNSLYMI